MSNSVFSAIKMREQTGRLPAFMRDVKKRQAEEIRRYTEYIELEKEYIKEITEQKSDYQRLLRHPSTPSYREYVISQIEDRDNKIKQAEEGIQEYEEHIQDTPVVSAGELGLRDRVML